MKVTNFEIASTVELFVANRLLDLHNNYDFAEVSYAPEQCLVTLRWVRGTGDWVKEELPSSLSLRITGVDLLTIQQRDQELPHSEDSCLECIAFLSNADWCTGPFLHDGLPEPGWAWVFRFMSGIEIVVQAREVTAQIG